MVYCVSVIGRLVLNWYYNHIHAHASLHRAALVFTIIVHPSLIPNHIKLINKLTEVLFHASVRLFCLFANIQFLSELFRKILNNRLFFI